MDAAEPAQFLVGHGSAAHPRTGVTGVHPQVDVADVGALEVRAVEAVQVPAGVEQHPGGAAGPRCGGEVGGPVLALLLGERVAGVFLEPPCGALAFLLLLLPLVLLDVALVRGVVPRGTLVAFGLALVGTGRVVPGLPVGLGRTGVGPLAGCGLGAAARLLIVGHRDQPFRRPASPVMRPMCTGCW
ncbi:hypothetical protein [Streptomyces sp. RLA2-12]|uniref:hypothetical protein n=1 Tax=Streptomyces sp. RLA2-12 TaxID=2721242 RepID=UPI002006EDA9|nr:hypothetical protein [Streptomyces sp. RLA2-12]